MVAGLLLFVFAVYEVVDRGHHQQLEQAQLEASLKAAAERSRREPEEGAAGARARAANGHAWGRLEIPRLGLSLALDEGIDEGTLRRAVGHLPGTPFPGEPGNVVLAGHRDGLFRPLKLLQDGDRLSVRTPDGDFRYRVTSLQIVAPDRTDLLVSGHDAELTLVTCYPFYYVGPAPQRYVVKARVAPADAPEGGGSSSSAK